MAGNAVVCLRTGSSEAHLEPNMVPGCGEETVVLLYLLQSVNTLSRRIMLVSVNEMLGSVTIDWQVPLEDVQKMPQQCESGLEITLAKSLRPSIFSSASNIKQIDCSIEHARVGWR